MKTNRSTVGQGMNLGTRQHKPLKGKGSYQRSEHRHRMEQAVGSDSDSLTDSFYERLARENPALAEYL